MRLYLLQLGLLPSFGDVAIPGYLIQTDDGVNVLIDTGYPRGILDAQEQAAERLTAAFPQDEIIAFNAKVIRGVRNAPEDLVANRLAELGLTPDDIDYLVCTHFDIDHAGNHDLFPNTEFVVQRGHYLAAHNHPRFCFFDIPWSASGLCYRLVEGESELLPGIELIETSGHVPGHQSVLVRLRETGPVLLAADAITGRTQLEPHARTILQDMNTNEKRASVRKLNTLVEREGVQLIVFGHDPEQWRTLKKSPEFYA